ncbi:hypothetical protein, partial [Crocosphaera sp.]|uniref:hypothetical protein n=1 Tax=Crocosphaera sp. TaxID=2729996 RepID=UPI0025797EDC
ILYFSSGDMFSVKFTLTIVFYPKSKINAYINNRGKKMQAWKGVLKVFEKRGIEPEMYYYEQ